MLSAKDRRDLPRLLCKAQAVRARPRVTRDMALGDFLLEHRNLKDDQKSESQHPLKTERKGCPQQQHEHLWEMKPGLTAGLLGRAQRPPAAQQGRSTLVRAHPCVWAGGALAPGGLMT